MLDLKNVTDNKDFWKTIKPFLTDKVTTFPKISLVEKGEIISDKTKVAKSFNNFFENAIRSHDTKANEHSSSIIFIHKNITNNENFHFSPTNHENILKEIINFDNKKMELLKTFLLAASRMYQMCVDLF